MCHFQKLAALPGKEPKDLTETKTLGKHIILTTEHITKVVDVSPVGQHVRDTEHLTGFGVRVPCHDHTELLASHVIGFTLLSPDPFNLSGAITERDELLQELRMSVLDVIQIKHDIVAHLQSQVELF